MPRRDELTFGLAVPWRRHGLEVVCVDDVEARGYVSIDWRGPTGAFDPEARSHVAPFVARVVDGGTTFTVVIGALLPRRYALALYPLDDELVGTVHVGLDRPGTRVHRAGVRARPESA